MTSSSASFKAASSLAIEHVAIDELRPDPANPRKMADGEMEALTRSLGANGLVQPIVARLSDKTVIAGHQRLTAARRLGLTHVPVICIDVSLEEGGSSTLP